MRSLRYVVPLFLFLTAANLQGQEESLTDAQRDGFVGPVRSVSTNVSNFNVKWAQPSGPTLFWPILCQDCDYDPDGTKTKAGQVVDGNFQGEIISLVRDANGHLKGRRVVSSSTGDVFREEVVGPLGRTEETVYMDGKPFSRQFFSYDQFGHLSDWLTFDGNGNQDSRSRTVTAKDGTVMERSAWGKSGDLAWRQTYEPETEVERFTTFDESGGVKLAWTRVRGEMISFWERENAPAQFGDSFVEDKGNGNRDNYNCHGDGKCDRFRIHYEYLEPDEKRNPKSAEWRDSEGNLLHAAYYEYELDASRNWTHRKVWVLAPDSGERTLYEEDARTIAYWQK